MAHVRTTKTNDGERRYVLVYRAPDGKQREQWFRTRRAADDHRKIVAADLMRGMWIDPRAAATTFDDWAKRWLAQNPAKRPSALARDETIVRVHLTPALEGRRLSSITPQDVQALVNTWSRRSAPGTVRRQYGTLRAILAAAVSNDFIARTPCRGIKLPAPEPISAHVVDSKELAALADALGPEWAAMAYLGAVLGLRWGECAGLRVRSVDFLGGFLTVAEQLTRGSQGRPVLGPPKSHAGRRTMAVPAALIEMLADQLARRGLTGADPDAFVFAMPDGEPLRYENWRRRIWLPAVEAALLGSLTFHDLRRACASGMVADRVDMKTAQTRLGHSDPRLTLAVYAQAMSDSDRSAADRLGDRFMAPSRGVPRGSRGVGA